jgi:hypothetical protein
VQDEEVGGEMSTDFQATLLKADLETGTRAFQEVYAIAEQALAREKKLLDALTKIACWDQGAEVTGSFDEPASAAIARKVLLELDKGA